MKAIKVIARVILHEDKLLITRFAPGWGFLGGKFELDELHRNGKRVFYLGSSKVIR
jgi:hypothetical protein